MPALYGRVLPPVYRTPLLPTIGFYSLALTDHHNVESLIFDAFYDPMQSYGPIPSDLPPLISVEAWYGKAVDYNGSVHTWAGPAWEYGKVTPHFIVGEGAPIFQPAVAMRSAVIGEPFALYSVALGEMPIGYQWQKGEADLPGETNVVLRFPEFRMEDAGAYTLIASNELGSAAQNFLVRAAYRQEFEWGSIVREGGTVTLKLQAERSTELEISQTTDLNGAAWIPMDSDSIYHDQPAGVLEIQTSAENTRSLFFRIRSSKE